MNENPRRIIGQDKVFCDKLIQLMEQGIDERVTREILQLINTLGVNKEIKLNFRNAVEAIKVSDKNLKEGFSQLEQIFGWNDNMGSGDDFPPRTFQAIYLLHDSFVEFFKNASQSHKPQNAKTSKDAFDFIINFTNKGGFLFLTEIFTAMKKDNIENSMLR